MFLFRIYSIPMGLSRAVLVMPSAGCQVVLYGVSTLEQYDLRPCG